MLEIFFEFFVDFLFIFCNFLYSLVHFKKWMGEEEEYLCLCLPVGTVMLWLLPPTFSEIFTTLETHVFNTQSSGIIW